MADAMVTARMGAGKKAAGSAVLDSLGLSASSAVNSLFDYLIKNGKMPDLSSEAKGEQASFETGLAEAYEWVKSIDGVVCKDNTCVGGSLK
jgi:antitoxin component of RelBE/YafQ-DinJ toxin-antitoxin module